jgi:type VI secretion system secreted protein Hcp
MAVDAFLQFKTPGDNAVALTGETKDKIMKAAPPQAPFEIASWSFGVNNPLSMGSASGGAGAGKVNFDSFTITKQIDQASPFLFHTCCAGGHYKELVLWLRRAGGSSAGQSGVVYLKFNFKLVMIENIEWSHGDPAPTENIKFAYGALSIVYYPQTSGGKTDSSNKKNAMWDRVLNANVFDGGYGSPTDPSTESNPGDN